MTTLRQHITAVGHWPGLRQWQVFLLYALAVFSSFSIAGIEFASILLMVLGLVHWQRAGQVDLPPWWFILPFLVWIGANVLSALMNPDVLQNLLKVKSNYRVFLPFALLPALALVNVRRWLAVLLAFLGLMALYGVVQHYVGVDWFRAEGAKLITPYPGGVVFHAKGNFTHHLTYAGFNLIAVPLFLALAFADKTRWRWLWAVGAVLAAAAVLYSLGRSGWIGAAVGTGLLVLMLPRRMGWPILVLGVASGALLVSLMLTGWLQATFSSPDNPKIVQRLLSTSLTRDKDRLYLWEAGWLGYKDNPVFGVGLNNDDRDYEQYRQIVSQRHGGYRFINRASAGVHNLYLQIAFTLGTVGLAAYLYLFGTVFAWCGVWLYRAGRAFPLERGLLWGAVGGLGGSMAAAFFENNFFDSEVQNMIVLVIGLALYAGMSIRSGLAAGRG